MFNLLKNIYIKFEGYKGVQLYRIIAFSFVVFLLIGLLFGFLVTPLLSPPKDSELDPKVDPFNADAKNYEGRIVFVDPNYYPQDSISYVLQDSAGKEVILLKSKDQKLVVAEGQFVKVYGTKQKTLDGTKDVLLVDKIVINNR